MIASNTGGYITPWAAGRDNNAPPAPKTDEHRPVMPGPPGRQDVQPRLLRQHHLGQENGQRSLEKIQRQRRRGAPFAHRCGGRSSPPCGRSLPYSNVDPEDPPDEQPGRHRPEQVRCRHDGDPGHHEGNLSLRGRLAPMPAHLPARGETSTPSETYPPQTEAIVRPASPPGRGRPGVAGRLHHEPLPGAPPAARSCRARRGTRDAGRRTVGRLADPRCAGDDPEPPPT